jgi:hypothetical protein
MVASIDCVLNQISFIVLNPELKAEGVSQMPSKVSDLHQTGKKILFVLHNIDRNILIRL